MFRELYRPQNPQGNLYWFSHAGAGAASLVRPSKGITSKFAIHAAMLPGREQRYREGVGASLSGLVDGFYDEIMKSPAPVIGFIGHSFGSLLSYLVCRRLVAEGRIPAVLTVMTLASPDRIHEIPRTADKTDEEFLDYLDNRFNGVPAALRENKEALDLFVPIVRYDMSLLEAYNDEPSNPLPVPLLTLGGTDDSAIPRGKLAGWEAYTSSVFSLRMMPGDHFFPLGHMQQVVTMTEKHLLRGSASASNQNAG